MANYDINTILDIFLDKISNEENDEIRRRTKKMFYDDIRKEIILKEKEKIITEALKEKEAIIKDGEKQKQDLINQGKKEVEKSKAMYAIEKAKNLFRDGIIIAFIVGIFVNQCTDLVTPLKQTISTASKINVVLITSIFVFVLACIIYLLIKKYYFNKVEEYIKNDGIKE